MCEFFYVSGTIVLYVFRDLHWTVTVLAHAAFSFMPETRVAGEFKTA
jgi:hypothetical protein